MYIFQLFDSHNTCTEQEVPLARTLSMARMVARKLSMQYVKVIVNEGQNWEQYEKGEKTEWSYPNGLQGAPEYGKQYSLTGKNSIANGNSWKESEVK